ncbi:alanine:cation symporter family protein, partial [Anaerostipes sp.]|uniref:alanine:cation symporter family protein n=1 Tax=Anaerostipes sp. TaxID=1872530 RepID=UPI003FEF203C
MIVQLIENIYSFLWGDLIHIPMPGGGSLGISLLILFLLPAGIYFTIRGKFLSIRLFPDMVRSLTEKKEEQSTLSSLQTLIVSTATRVGMGNLTGVVAAISAGGAGAVFWMWVTALIGSSTAFIEATLAQLYKEKDPLYGGYRGGPAYYIHHFFEEKQGKKKKHVLWAVLFAISGLICWCGISQVVSNSVTSSFENAFSIPPIYTSIALVIVAAFIVLRKNATVKVLDIIV